MPIAEQAATPHPNSLHNLFTHDRIFHNLTHHCPFSRQLRQLRQVARLGQHLGLEASHLAGGGRRVFRGSPADHVPHREIDRASRSASLVSS